MNGHMILSKVGHSPRQKDLDITSSKRRRVRRKKLHAARSANVTVLPSEEREPVVPVILTGNASERVDREGLVRNAELDTLKNKLSSKEMEKSRGDVLAAREAKKLAKQKAKSKAKSDSAIENNLDAKKPSKGKDETDRALNREDIGGRVQAGGTVEPTAAPVDSDMTVKDVVNTLKDIANVAKNIEQVTAKVNAINLESKKAPEVAEKSKAELRAERRAKQEAQRAAKAAAPPPVTLKPTLKVSEKTPKSSVAKKPAKQGAQRVNWFQHLDPEHDKDTLKKVAASSNLHPAVVKLGVQLSRRTVRGADARCAALVGALQQVVAGGAGGARALEPQLTAAARYLWASRAPAAAQLDALNHLRRRLAHLSPDLTEFDAKRYLQSELHRYVREQLRVAADAISLAVRAKIADGDRVLTYGCSSLVERVLRDAWQAGVHFRVEVVVGGEDGREAARRLAASGVPVTCVGVEALAQAVRGASKVVVGACAVLANGWVVGAAGTAHAALAAHARNVPVLVVAETHKFSSRVQTDAFVHNELGDPDDLVHREGSPLARWRTNPRLTPLNLRYDVTPPQLVTAVVTELAVLPCTSAPVVLRFKLSEYAG